MDQHGTFNYRPRSITSSTCEPSMSLRVERDAHPGAVPQAQVAYGLPVPSVVHTPPHCAQSDTQVRAPQTIQHWWWWWQQVRYEQSLWTGQSLHFIPFDLQPIPTVAGPGSAHPHWPPVNPSAPNTPALQPLGPPPKPRCHGCAIWIGNLPPNVDISDLVELFSDGATHTIESIKFIRRTACAFVNYSSPDACQAASVRHNGSEYRGNPLTCRTRIRDLAAEANNVAPLRRPNLRQPSSAPDSPSSSTSPSTPSGPGGAGMAVARGRRTITGRVPARFFVMKSLTVQDVPISVEQGLWITQTHNADALAQAFDVSDRRAHTPHPLILSISGLADVAMLLTLLKTADSVYLFFSVNRSGQFCGFARMESSILTSIADASTQPPTPTSPSFSQEAGTRGTLSHTNPNIRVTMTPATTKAPKGRIVEDLAHDVVFWEAELDAAARAKEAEQSIAREVASFSNLLIVSSTSGSYGKKACSRGGLQASDGPNQTSAAFRLRWLSLLPLPFHMTRGLKNAWNMDRDVKVARDGTEIDPATGARLMALFQESKRHSVDGRMWGPGWY